MDSPPELDELSRLARSEDLADRSFVNGVLRLRYARFPEERAKTKAAYAEARACSLRIHARTRAALKDGSLRGARLRELLERVGDAFTEELLDVAHPPLEELRLPPHHTPYIASGLAEVLHALDVTGLGPDDTLVDVGAGLGKVVMLANLLTGARAEGVELDSALVGEARQGAKSLGLDRVSFVQGDARTAELAEARVYYLFSPFSAEVLDAVMARLRGIAERREVFVCASAAGCEWLTPVSAPSSWLVVHRSPSLRASGERVGERGRPA